MTPIKALSIAGAALYVVMFVVTFGPAAVDTEHEKRANYDECLRQKGDQGGCIHWKAGAEPVFKATFWPLWISYKVAAWDAGRQKKGGGS
ncbi:MAG: hypothetical protein REI09_05375 [Candidatus Dactylopiibacterium sp.]|nr:hypothetical protein [Candidatus Dactylopiibacterium sp.]